MVHRLFYQFNITSCDIKLMLEWVTKNKLLYAVE